MTINELPGSQTTFKLESGEGQRYVFGSHLATIIARAEDIGFPMAGAILTGAKGSTVPIHQHAKTHEALFVVEGMISLTLGEQTFTLSPGDYVNIPPHTAHGFSYLDHRVKLLAWTFGGAANLLYSTIGKPYSGIVYRESAEQVDWSKLDASVDTALARYPQSTQSGEKLEKSPAAMVPFVLAAGEGERMIAGDQVYTIMGNQQSSNGLFVSLMTEGPIGRAIPRHLHEKVSETFYCLNGAMEMFAGDQFVTLNPGDFLHIPPRTPHSFQLLKHDTRFLGFVAPGFFENFFRYLCEPFDGYMYPLVPPPFRFDRVLQHMAELDLKLLEKPGPPQAGS